MMIICAAIAIAGAFLVSFFVDMKKTVISLWVTGLGMAGIYLSLGSELLAVIQIIFSTLACMVFLFYSVLLGEYGARDDEPPRKKVLSVVPAFLMSAGFFAALYIGMNSLSTARVPEEGPVAVFDLRAVSAFLVRDHTLSVEILGVTLLLVLTGSAVVSRPEGRGSE